MKLQVRPYEAHDTVALLELFYDTVHGVNSKDYPVEQLDAWAPPNPDLKKRQAKFKAGKTIVAQLDGKIVGFGSLENEQSIGMLYVHKDHQNQDIATALLAKLEKKLLKRDIKIATLEASITAKPFFERRGYRVVKENRKMLNGIEFLNYNMEKDLSAKEEKKIMKEKLKGPKPFNWRDLFFNKVFDLMIVIVGVSVAFQLNNLKLNADQKSLERFYMESMLGDLRSDQKQIAEILTALKSDQKSISNYITKSKDASYPADSLGPVLRDVLSLETFTPAQNTYQMLLASNGLTAFSDRSMRSLTAEYYNTYASIARFEDVDTKLLFEAYAYFSPYVDLSEARIIDHSIVTSVRTKNLLLMANGQLADGVEAHEDAYEKASHLIKTIESKLRNP